MATMVCQGLQSCLESPIVESRTLRLRLCSPNTHFSQSQLELALKPPRLLDSNTKQLSEETNLFLHEKQTPSNQDLGGWSFLQALSSTPAQDPKESITQKENSTATYVHPLVNRSCSMLSEKSLELCTENLGSETGSDHVIEDTHIFLSSSRVGNSPTREQHRQLLGAKKVEYYSRSFPPPLTTMSGSRSLQVKPHREDGRLIIKAVKATTPHTYLHAERSNGRLRLCFVKDFDSEEEEEEEEEDEENIQGNNNGREYLDDEVVENGYMNYDDLDDAGIVEDEEGDVVDLAGKLGLGSEEEFQRPRSGCKEEGEIDNKGGLLNLNWEPFWVTTS